MTDCRNIPYSGRRLFASVSRMLPISPIEIARSNTSFRHSCIWVWERRLPTERMQTYFFTCSPKTAFLEGMGHPEDCFLHCVQYPTSTSCLMTVFRMGKGMSSSKNTLTDFLFNA